MGSVLSTCCGLRPPKRTGEREPLLPQHRDRDETVDAVIPDQQSLNKIADLLAALNNGKLPSQDQLNSLIRRILQSQIFKEANKDKHDTLSQRGQLVLRDLDELLRAFMELGIEKNDDDKVQDIYDELRNVQHDPVSIDADLNLNLSGKDAAASELPDEPPISKDEAKHDALIVRDSVQNLISLLFTSSAFRLLLTDIFVTGRGIIADLIHSAGEVAQAVASGADVVEGVVRPTEDEQKQVDEHQTDADEQLPSTEEIRTKQAEIKVDAEKKILDTVNKGKQKGQEAWEEAKQESPDRVKETVIERIKTIVSQAQQNPDFQKSIQTIIDIGTKYFDLGIRTASQVSNAAQAGISSAVNDSSITSDKIDIDVDPHLHNAFMGLNVLIERFAGMSVDPVVDKVNVVMEAAKTQVEGEEDDSVGSNFQKVVAEAKEWLNKAIAEPSWAQSDETTQQLGKIYDSAKNVVDGDAEPQRKLKEDITNAVQSFRVLADSLAKDQALQRFLKAVATFGTDTAYIISISSPDVQALATRQARHAAAQVACEIRNDVLGFILPRLLKVIRVIPLPRVEYKSPSVEAVLDDLNVASISFMPDIIKVTNWSEILLVGSDRARERQKRSLVTLGESAPPTVTVMEAMSRTRIHVEGLRISAKEIAYFIDAKGPLYIGWQDHGLITVDVGEEGVEGRGMRVDVELEMIGEDLDIIELPSHHDRQTAEGFFKVLDVRVDAPGLTFTISKSKHWIFNSLLLQPLLGPSVRQVLATVLASQIKAGLEAVDMKLLEARKQAIKEARKRDESPSWGDIARVVYRSVTTSRQTQQETPRQEEGPPDAVTSTSLTTKGVIMTSHQPATTHDQDTIIAVGIGEQVLTEEDAPLPHPDLENGGHAKKLEDVPMILREEGREALDELQNGADATKGKAKDLVGTIGQAREQVGQEVRVARERLQERNEMEAKKDGWRSDAFSL
ncbi:hypothetical protein FRB94_012125 [Tulasnella sp. JGI-2019a]|nr:hypothetical protein FRB94_012125 [Tulasnella sp. JGI-2019a]